MDDFNFFDSKVTPQLLTTPTPKFEKIRWYIHPQSLYVFYQIIHRLSPHTDRHTNTLLSPLPLSKGEYVK